MAASWGRCGRGRVVQVVVGVVVMVLSLSAHATEGQKNILNPDFPCGSPYGPNGERPSGSHRGRRQIIFPDEENYQLYFGMLFGRSGMSVNKPRNEKLKNQPDDELQEGSFCGAVVISDRFLVTAAHCLQNEPIGSVLLGATDLRRSDKSYFRNYDIRENIINREYKGRNSSERYNDVALLMTYETIHFNDVVFPYCLPAATPPPGSSLTISGFGGYNVSTPQTTVLLEANVTVLDTKECEDIYIRENLVTRLRVKYPNMLQGTDIFCATDEVSDACQGDSGGPAILRQGGKEYLAGIVVSGASCGNFKSVLPGLYLDMSKHVDFINRIINEDVPPPEDAVPEDNEDSG